LSGQRHGGYLQRRDEFTAIEENWRLWMEKFEDVES
jgi:hypothetical protein